MYPLCAGSCFEGIGQILLLNKMPKSGSKMNNINEWGRDPSVQIMRKVFKEMETAQHKLLRRLAIAPYDLRIRKWREKTLALFEQAWTVAKRIGISMDESMTSAVYVHLLAKTIGSEGNEIPQGILPERKELERLFKEML
jgi:hypothetical protein